MSPCPALYGTVPRHMNIPMVPNTRLAAVGDFLKDKSMLNAIIKESLVQAQQRYKHQADKHRSEREFQVGDYVFLKL